jgi:putative nucleotidyltransferase with HDIG domain
MIEQVLEKIFNKIEHIPTFPKTAQRALELLQSEDVNFKELEKVIKSDPGIAANFLKMVNSAAFGLPQKVDSLLKAFMFLGVSQIRFILLASVAGEYFNKELIGYGVSATDIWLHSLTAGFIAEELAVVLGFSREKIESLYIASILHDIGKIVLDMYTKLEISEFQKVMESNPDWDFIQVEWLVLGVDHGLVGAHLLKRWEFPEEISFAIRAHHDPDLMLQSKIAALVGFSNILSNAIGISGGIDSFYYKVPERLLDFLGLNPEEITKILKKVLIKTVYLKRDFF